MLDADPDPSTDGDPWPSAFGERLRSAREEAGMSQEHVTQHLGYPTRSLTRWENGKCDPGFEKVARLAAFYGVSTDWIAGKTPITQTSGFSRPQSTVRSRACSDRWRRAGGSWRSRRSWR